MSQNGGELMSYTASVSAALLAARKQGRSQDLETGCPKIGSCKKIFGVQGNQITTINMHLVI